MVAKNEFTGDMIQSKPPTDAYKNGWERIFGNKQKQEADKPPVDDTTKPENY